MKRCNRLLKHHYVFLEPLHSSSFFPDYPHDTFTFHTHELGITAFSSSKGGVKFNQHCCRETPWRDNTAAGFVFLDSYSRRPQKFSVRCSSKTAFQAKREVFFRSTWTYLFSCLLLLMSSDVLQFSFLGECFCFVFPAVIRMPASSTASLRAFTT